MKAPRTLTHQPVRMFDPRQPVNELDIQRRRIHWREKAQQVRAVAELQASRPLKPPGRHR